MEQGSYMLIEPGMAVHGVDGHVGTVSEVVADTGVDVFRGLVVAHGMILTHKALVPAEAVVSVANDIVTISMTKAHFEALPRLNTSSTVSVV